MSSKAKSLSNRLATLMDRHQSSIMTNKYLAHGLDETELTIPSVKQHNDRIEVHLKREIDALHCKKQLGMIHIDKQA